jgi:hypothetical protein
MIAESRRMNEKCPRGLDPLGAIPEMSRTATETRASPTHPDTRERSSQRYGELVRSLDQLSENDPLGRIYLMMHGA